MFIRASKCNPISDWSQAPHCRFTVNLKQKKFVLIGFLVLDGFIIADANKYIAYWFRENISFSEKVIQKGFHMKRFLKEFKKKNKLRNQILKITQKHYINNNTYDNNKTQNKILKNKKRQYLH